MPKQKLNQFRTEEWILKQTPEGGRVLDIGCGTGDLLARFKEERSVRGTGIEKSEECVAQAVQRGLSVHHGDAEEGMDHYSDNTFDLVVMSCAIQEMANPIRMIEEAFRIGKQLVIVFPNFGHWRARWQLAALGRAPQTPSFPYKWHESPNRRFFSIADWEALCHAMGWRVKDRQFLSGGRRIQLLPNLRAEVALYLITNGGEEA